MRKILMSVFCLLTACMMCQAEEDSAKVRLMELVQMTNDLGSLDLGALGKLTNVTYQNNVVTYHVLVKESMKLSVNPNGADSTTIRVLKSSLSKIASNNWFFKSFVSAVNDAGASFGYELNRESSGESVTITLSHQDIADIVNGKAETLSPTEFIDFQIKKTNNQCPQKLDEFTILTRVSVEGKYMVYFQEFVENAGVSVDMLSSMQETFRKNILKKWKTEPTLEEIKNNLKAVGYGLEYRFEGNMSGNVVSIKIESDEL